MYWFYKLFINNTLFTSIIFIRINLQVRSLCKILALDILGEEAIPVRIKITLLNLVV